MVLLLWVFVCVCECVVVVVVFLFFVVFFVMLLLLCFLLFFLFFFWGGGGVKLMSQLKIKYTHNKLMYHYQYNTKLLYPMHISRDLHNANGLYF